MVKDSYFLCSKCFVKYQQFFLLQGVKSLKGGKLSEGKFLPSIYPSCLNTSTDSFMVAEAPDFKTSYGLFQ